MFLARPGEYPPCGIFNIEHLILLISTFIVIVFAVKYTKIKEKKDVTKIIRIATIIVWILEILKIAFVFSVGNGGKLNKVVPLYYCSLLLYTGILSSIGKGIFKRLGDVFLATGALVAGIVFMFFPTTSLPEYPVFHFMSLHSFFFHGMMVYVSCIVNKTNYIEIKRTDIKYYASLIFIICVAAYIVNSLYGSNLMFISQNFPGTPIEFVYELSGKWFPIVMSVIQMTLPFYIIYALKLLKDKFTKGEKENKPLKVAKKLYLKNGE